MLIAAISLIPNPAEEDVDNQNLAERKLDVDLTGIFYNVAVGIGYGAGYCCRTGATLGCGHLAVLVNGRNLCVRGRIFNLILCAIVSLDCRLKRRRLLVVQRDIVNRNGLDILRYRRKPCRKS